MKLSDHMHIAILLGLLSCVNVKDNEQIEVIHDDVIQAFVNDNAKHPKLMSMNMEYFKENVQVHKVDTIMGVKLIKYIIPAECGGCPNYELVSLYGKMKLTIPNNSYFWLQKYADNFSDSISFEKKIILLDYLNNCKIFQNGLNTFLSEEFKSKDDAMSFSKVILRDYFFDGELSDKVNSGVVKDSNKYILNKDYNTQSIDYYWLNGAVIMVDWSHAVENKIINVKILGPDNFYNTRY